MRIGMDVGSTTLKYVVADDNDNLIYKSYERHFSEIRSKIVNTLKLLKDKFGDKKFNITISGSAGMGIATLCDIPFVQEVYATRVAVNKLLEGTNTVIELGGEDAKIIFLTDGMEVRMNGTCAGGTGAFIDQMATLLNVDIKDLDNLAKDHEKTYTIASRCGVFAKTDIQPLLNQGAKKTDIAESIFMAVVNQTIAGLAQGREIKGNVVYLGGPLTFMSRLRANFDSALNVKGYCPENSLYYVALGSNFLSQNTKEFSFDELIEKIQTVNEKEAYVSCEPLFKNEKEYEDFKNRHSLERIDITNPKNYKGKAFLGVDAGSTTIKTVIVDESEKILFSKYQSNNGNPVTAIREVLSEFYQKYPDISLSASAATGYGEDIIKNAFRLDFGIVETMAHFIAAKKFKNDVDFIVDIGGQDIKCLKIVGGAIDNIFLNEACSSGCGSFLQSFAGALGKNIDDFSREGLLSRNPVDLGSRCTVFMNSSVKQAQKDGATVEDISAGLSISVVKNALYKVIRTTNAENLGKNVVVQGGTFLNDAVLRAFEKEIGKNVIRPNISGLMGAYGAALYAKKNATGKTNILTLDELKVFRHEVSVVTCKGCGNSCKLTINSFDGERKFIGGNRCDKPLKLSSKKLKLNMYDYKLSLLDEYGNKQAKGNLGRIGLPLALYNYELLPFFHTILSEIGFEVVVSKKSTRELYLKGQHTIPSDTVCFPAKLVHGHIEELLDEKVDAIFCPALTYNMNEHIGDNHFNCPVVAYYGEVIKANVKRVKETKLIDDYLGIHNPKTFKVKLYNALKDKFDSVSFKKVKKAVDKGFKEYKLFQQKILDKGSEFIKTARQNNMPIIVLSGRPYHVDPEVNHGIDKLITECGAVVITEDSIIRKEKIKRGILNQWTYHARLYNAADFVAKNSDVNLVQLVSFGCGLDAVTTDEVREILERSGKIYTQIKIDEITNLGAVKIRLRSLFEALKQEKGKNGKK